MRTKYAIDGASVSLSGWITPTMGALGMAVMVVVISNQTNVRLK
jgi:hypothetical protein